MKMIKHKNVLELKEVLASNSKIYVVLELIKCGDLYKLVGKSICVNVCLSVYIHVSMHICVYGFISICVYNVYMSIYLYMYNVYLSISLYVLSLYPINKYRKQRKNV